MRVHSFQDSRFQVPFDSATSEKVRTVIESENDSDPSTSKQMLNTRVTFELRVPDCACNDDYAWKPWLC